MQTAPHTAGGQPVEARGCRLRIQEFPLTSTTARWGAYLQDCVDQCLVQAKGLCGECAIAQGFALFGRLHSEDRSGMGRGMADFSTGLWGIHLGRKPYRLKPDVRPCEPL